MFKKLFVVIVIFSLFFSSYASAQRKSHTSGGDFDPRSQKRPGSGGVQEKILITPEEYEEKMKGARTAKTVGIVLLGSGVVSLAAGTVCFVWGMIDSLGEG